MALTNCPECNHEIADTAYDCPKCGASIRKATRSFFGKIVKWLFIGFNIIMVLWLFQYVGFLGESAGSAASDAEKAGTVIGGAIGTGLLVGIWVAGDIILGLFFLFTRPSKS